MERNSLQIVIDNAAIIGPERRILSESLIDVYKETKNPWDNLSLAWAYENLGAKYRTKAIEHYERFLENPIFPKIIGHNCFSMWSIHSSLAALYEKEYNFEAAISCLKQCISDNRGSNPADFTRIGDILVKIDVHKGVEFFRYLIHSPFYKQHRHSFDCALKSALDKEQRGYVYRPRPRK